MKLKRHPTNPILLPIPDSEWESLNVFNPAVIYQDGLFHMHYRAQGYDKISRIGYASSSDGVIWDRLPTPVLEPTNELETEGVEDPRVTRLDGKFNMTYTAYAGRSSNGMRITPMLATSTDLINWDKLGPLIEGEENKNHILFPEHINGRHVWLHRRAPDVWIAESEDLLPWPEESMRIVFSPRKDNGWDSKQVGGAGVPIKTEAGWLTIYHAYDQDHVYGLGVCLLDLDDPGRVTHRPKDPIFEPEESWELLGDVPNVVFSCANPVVEGTVFVFYGAADHVIGLATCSLDKLLDYALSG